MHSLPLELVNIDSDGLHLLLDVSIFDRRYKVVLDTGASRTVFDQQTITDIAGEFALQEIDNRSAGLGTNSMQSFTVTIPELRIGDDFIINNYVSAILDLSAIRVAYEQLNMPPLVGVIGGDILFRYQAVIDYKEQILHLNDLRVTSPFIKQES